MLHVATRRDGLMTSIEIEGVEYYSASDIVEKIGISRQTFWRWRQQGKIPLGNKYRDGRILFTTNEYEKIYQFANHIVPVENYEANQIKLL